jgi:hypothetical protein
VSVTLHEPPDEATVVARTLLPSRTAITAPASAVPATVTLALACTLLLAGAVSTGAAGAVVSTRMVTDADGAET